MSKPCTSLNTIPLGRAPLGDNDLELGGVLAVVFDGEPDESPFVPGISVRASPLLTSVSG